MFKIYHSPTIQLNTVLFPQILIIFLFHYICCRIKCSVCVLLIIAEMRGCSSRCHQSRPRYFHHKSNIYLIKATHKKKKSKKKYRIYKIKFLPKYKTNELEFAIQFAIVKTTTSSRVSLKQEGIVSVCGGI